MNLLRYCPKARGRRGMAYLVPGIGVAYWQLLVKKSALEMQESGKGDVKPGLLARQTPDG